jgi:hypothetical protein
VHREVDEHHLRLGLDECGDVAIDSPTGMLYQRVLWHAAGLYHQMLSSWVGVRVEPLAPLWSENVSTGLLLEPPRPASVAQGTIRLNQSAKS